MHIHNKKFQPPFFYSKLFQSKLNGWIRELACSSRNDWLRPFCDTTSRMDQRFFRLQSKAQLRYKFGSSKRELGTVESSLSVSQSNTSQASDPPNSLSRSMIEMLSPWTDVRSMLAVYSSASLATMEASSNILQILS